MKLLIFEKRDAWEGFLSLFDPKLRDVHFSYDYVALFAAQPGGKPVAAGFEGSSGSKVFYPFVLKQIPENVCGSLSERFFSIESAYGFGGPLADHPNDDELAGFESLFMEWCIERNVTAEFTRFHPLFSNQNLFKANIVTELNRVTVTVNLESGWDAAFSAAAPTRRRNFRKALRAGLSHRISDDFASFHDLYIETMKRLGADQRYLFTRDFFEEIRQHLSDSAFIVEITHGNLVVSAGLFLRSGKQLYYFLGASLEGFSGVAPNDMMIFSAIKWGCENGCTVLQLGGGLSLSPDDGLMRFKAGFSCDRADYWIGKRVHNAARHEAFIQARQLLPDANPSMFLSYN